MTAPVIPMTDSASPASADVDTARAPAPRLSSLWLSSPAVLAAPGRIGRWWVNASLSRAAAVAALNVVAGAAWLYLAGLAWHLWSSNALRTGSRGLPVDRWAKILHEARAWPASVAHTVHIQAAVDQIALAAAAASFLVAALLLPFFVILPFAARPGRNKACLGHVARTVLLGTGAVHAWGLTYVTIFAALAAFPGDSPAYEHLRVITPVLAAFTALTLWTTAALAAAARADYRRPEDMPAPHDPWCDECGYILLAADAGGRCPECGRPVTESLGAHNRAPTPWERWPSARNLPAIGRQFLDLVRRPRDLFFSMSTLTGQPAAHRWLVLSLLVIGGLATGIVPGIAHAVDAPWSLELAAGALAMGVVWALLAAMMVGIETAGIAAFSRMRGHPGGGVYLAAAAKVTCYSSTLMFLWVVLGGAQLVGLMYKIGPALQPPAGMSIRTQQIILALSLSAAHIGGLLWYELTVYRGIRGIQYANR
jgi:hypothetical protein